MEQNSPVSSTVYDKMRRCVAWFTEPPQRITDPLERRRAQALLALLGLSALISVGLATFFTVWYGQIGIGATLATLISLGIYVITRWVSYRIGTLVALVGILITPYILYLFGSTAFSLLLLFSSMLTSVLTSMLLPVLAITGMTIIVNVGMVCVFFLTAPGFTSVDIIQFMSAYGLMASFLFGAAVIVNKDVQQVRDQSAALEESADRLQKLLSVAPEAILVLAEGKIVYANALAATSLGYETAADIIGRQLHTTSTDTITSRMRRYTQSSSFAVQSQDTFYIDAGTTLTAEATATPITYDGHIAIFLLLRPLDEATSRARELPHLMHETFRQALDATLIISLTTPEPTIAHVNPALCELAGFSAKELLGAAPEKIYQHLTDAKGLSEALLAGESVMRRTVYRQPTGRALQVRLYVAPAYDATGKLTHGIITICDVSRAETMREMLKEREERYLTLANLMSDYAYALTLDEGAEIFKWVTGSVSDLTGRSPDEILALPGWEGLLHDEDKPLYRLRQRNILKGQTRTQEYRLLQPDGTVRWVQDTARPMHDDNGNVTHIVGAAHDITERVQAQEALKTHVVQQAVVAELGLLAMSHQDEGALLEHTVVLVQQVLQIDVANIFAHHPEDDLLRLVATTSEISIPHEMTVPDGVTGENASLAGYTLQANEPVVIKDYRTDDSLPTYHHLSQAGYRSGVSLAIQGREQPYGVMSVHTWQVREFSEDDIYFLQSVSNVIGTFIERSRAQRAERDQRELTEALREASIIINSQLELPVVLEKIQSFMAKLVPENDLSYILLLDAEAVVGRFVSYRTSADISMLPDSDMQMPLAVSPPLQQVVAQKTPLIITEESEGWIVLPGLEWVKSSLLAPIVVQERCIGVLSISSSQHDAFTQQHADMLQTFAEKTGNAIINARRAEELERLVKERTTELKREREQLQTILDSTGEGIFYAENEEIRYINQALVEMTGYTVEDFNSATTDMLLPDDEPRKTTLARRIDVRQHLRQGLTWRSEHLIQRKDGTTFEAGLTVSRVGGDNDTIQAVTILRDISDEKALERQKERFIDHAAHELRSPVTSLNTRIYLIRRKDAGFDEHLQHLEKISARMNRLASDLLDLSSFEKGHIVLRKESVVLQNVLTDTTEMHRPEAELDGIDLSLEAPDVPVQILGDPHRLKQVFTNLVTNAIHYTPEGESVTVRCHADDGDAYIDVCDTGPGISEEDQAHIFQPFYRATKDKQGTGLGLSIAKEIVDLHGGSLTVSSVIGQGSTFTVRLPLIDG